MAPLPAYQPLPAPNSTLPFPNNPISYSNQPNPKPSITDDTFKGYSLVNKLSLLPPEVRTMENLEGDTIPANIEAELVEQYQKERADYEEKQLREMADVKAKRAGGGKSSKEHEAISTVALHTPSRPHVGGGRGGIDPYEDPVDAVLHKVGVAKKSGGSPQSKKLNIGGADTVGEEYTVVFDTLPTGQVEKVQPILAKTVRGLSDSSPTRKSPRTPTAPTPAATALTGPATSPSLTTSYENSPFHSSANDAVADESPGASDDSNPGKVKRQDSTRQSNRKPAKEVVEFDPNKPKKFRMTSSIKKRSDGKTDDGVNLTDASPMASQTDEGTQWAEAATTPTRSFSIHTAGGQLSYALVNMEDKKKNRMVSDASKTEGSGVPQHYKVPIATS